MCVILHFQLAESDAKACRIFPESFFFRFPRSFFIQPVKNNFLWRPEKKPEGRRISATHPVTAGVYVVFVCCVFV